MALLEIKTYPDKVLRERAAIVNNIGQEILQLIDDMIETMYAAPGIGLAAPQVGVSKRVIVIDIRQGEEAKTPLLAMINPEIVYAEGEVSSEEGCLSIPGYTANVKRAEKIIIHGLNRKGKALKIECTDLLAISLQHEIDHLNGILLIDRISPIKREFFKKRFKKALAKI